jgi:hypothetical protein
MNDEHELLQATLTARVATDAQIIAVHERDGAQGYSGAILRYYDIDYAHECDIKHSRLVTKPAPLVERLASTWLAAQGAAVPFCHTLDLVTDAPAQMGMQFVGDRQPEGAHDAARALASVHAAAMNCHEELAWLPRADVAFAEQWLIEKCWRAPWQRVMAGEPFTNVYGQSWGPITPGGDFEAEFAAYTRPLEAAARFVQTMAELWAQGDALTLIHADFHDHHARTYGGRDYVIDFGFAHYGPLYIDLPNYFTRDEALLYRDALAELGHDIPQATFLANYDAIHPYPGFKYFMIGLGNWCYGDPPHRRDTVMHFIDMIL